MFDKTEDEPSGACLIIPAPNLFAEPSRPSASTARSVNMVLEILRIFRAQNYLDFSKDIVFDFETPFCSSERPDGSALSSFKDDPMSSYEL